jgi:uncharacterized membrane protein
MPQTPGLIDVVTTALLWFTALGCGVMAGIYFAFSAFIMAALRRAIPAVGIAAMNSINVVILRSPFMPLFWGTTLASVALAAIALSGWNDVAAQAMFAGGAVYVLGMFVCTVVFNVPLNNALQAVDAGSDAALPVWQRYLSQWTRWNHGRVRGGVRVVHPRARGTMLNFSFPAVLLRGGAFDADFAQVAVFTP